ncbi:MAG: insulinase family protein, partial [Treponemataceae bacterium]|nr:insulinase family protein [Treponemataceae bacterium]
TFMQEGHRFEVDENGNLVFQGVVFNEMKGSYSSSEGVIQEEIKKYLLPQSCYQYDSGGDPVEIPSLTYEQFKDFHNKYYHPSNCFLFLYGDIPTEKQIDFLQENFLSRFTETQLASGKAFCQQDFFSQKTFSPELKESIVKKVSVPKNGGEKENSVIISWRIGEVKNPEVYMKGILLAEILVGHDGAPLTKALLKSGLGEDLSPNIGLDSDLRYVLLTVGMRGVKKSNINKLVDLVFDVLKNVVENGIDPDDLESAMMSVEFSNREIVRSYSPYSLVLMRRAYRTWLNGGNPYDGIMTYRAFEKIKSELKNNPKYIEKFVKDLIYDNQQRLTLIATPDKNYNLRNEKNLKERIKLLKKSMSKSEYNEFIEKVRADCKKLEEMQSKKESESVLALMPHINPRDLEIPKDDSKLERCKIKGIDFFSCEQNVNGVVYFQMFFPVDVLQAKDYLYLNFFASALMNVGFDGKSWSESSVMVSKTTGGFSSDVYIAPISPWLLEKVGAKSIDDDDLDEKLYENDPSQGRRYLVVKMKFLEEKLDDALDMFFKFLTTVNFSDKERLSNLAKENRNDLVSSVVSSGHDYAVSRTTCNFSKLKAIDEITTGLTSVIKAVKIAEENPAELAEYFESLKNQIFNSGFLFNVVAEKTGIEKSKAYLESNVEKLKEKGLYFGALKPKAKVSSQEFFDLVKIQGETEDFETYQCETQVGYCAKSFECSKSGTKESVYESIYAHYLSNNVLWEKIRMAGGAYGVFAVNNTLEGIFSLLTYRDPSPVKNARLLDEILQGMDDFSISQEEFERIITGCFSREIQPKSPSARGFSAFVRYAAGIPDSFKEQRIKWLLSSTVEDLKATARSFVETEQKAKTAIISSKIGESYGKIIDIVL